MAYDRSPDPSEDSYKRSRRRTSPSGHTRTGNDGGRREHRRSEASGSRSSADRDPHLRRSRYDEDYDGPPRDSDDRRLRDDRHASSSRSSRHARSPEPTARERDAADERRRKRHRDDDYPDRERDRDRAADDDRSRHDSHRSSRRSRSPVAPSARVVDDRARRSPPAPSAAPSTETEEEKRQRQRLEKLQAWKLKQAAAKANVVGTPTSQGTDTPPAKAASPAPLSSKPTPATSAGAPPATPKPLPPPAAPKKVTNGAAPKMSQPIGFKSSSAKARKTAIGMEDEDDEELERRRSTMYKPDLDATESLPAMDHSAAGEDTGAGIDEDDDDEVGESGETEEERMAAAGARARRQAEEALASGLDNVDTARDVPQEESAMSIDLPTKEVTPVETKSAPTVSVTEPEEDDEIDPLDAFMTGVTEQVKQVNASDIARSLGGAPPPKEETVMNLDEDAGDDDGEPDEYEKAGLRPEDILALAAKKLKKKDLAPVDHSRIKYESFRKAFYHPPPEIAAMTEEEATVLRGELDAIKIRGADYPKPITKWSHCGLPAICLDVIRQLDYASPTPIQAQAIPSIMSGRDMIGVAKTGSGKTIAFLLPMFRHIKDQRPLEMMEGPIAMIMTPTRELANQIYRECKPFLKALNLRAICSYGGSPLKDNINDLKKGAEVIVCTPGRMIELLGTNSGRLVNLRRITYLVLDEADRMFDMGFEPQVMKIISQVRPDRQTVLFSATFPRQMEALARKVLKKPLEITVGGRSVVAAEIEQIIEVVEDDAKFERLLALLGRLTNDDKDAQTLVFVDRQEAADDLLQRLSKRLYLTASLHGGKDQVDRDDVIAQFKQGIFQVVVATSVAARGLDVKGLKLVVNFDCPNHLEDYVHRAGRTGRAGNKGTCVTFITKDQDRYSMDLVKALENSNAPVPADLRKMAADFLQKVKDGNATTASSGFGGKGLDRFELERDAKNRAERNAYGEPAEDGAAKPAGEATVVVPDIEVEIKRGPAPDPVAPRVVDQAEAMAAAERVASSNKGATALERAQLIAANFNRFLKDRKTELHGGARSDDIRRRDPDATDFHASIPINDYSQKTRWKVTNKETMVQLIEETGASITNKGVFYDKGKEPGPLDQPKLHLLVESNDESKVRAAINEIKRILIEASTASMEAEQRGPGQATGRYSIL
ncbi:uncharacterized protein L969DRAFT_91839 [Mixia osmundae IAM 14324]|uniref:RNA helicase n=1 Tax=Mixia osmundae (strain CBS 9802 / IAM 14324 / JCM 22182 / KY 12970) TaxID=764103 RepID=G7E856_MIXOS|nr:uncharacterized protein L969DRAFT_91839 [Mixia osmundae IAM 14324]KEI42392.1 hypothetical protein L969DRAFT_91839 [Mixia osmundae IAM 14324]GAA99016.1 hypothetical protein E5Q_05705 [Mixia osmundae IAM 14324]